MASSDSVRPKLATKNDDVDVDPSWPPLSQPSPSKLPENKRKGTRGLSPQSQSQQLVCFPPHQIMHHPSSRRTPNRFMAGPPPPPPPNYMPPACYPLPFGALTEYYMPTLPPASSFGPTSPVVYPPPFELKQKIIQQINYYFCDDNLAKDVFLRSKMDDKGWVSVHTIASFPQVSHLTNSSQLILDCMRDSNTVEVGNWKLRRRGNWTKWLLPAPPKELNT